MRFRTIIIGGYSNGKEILKSSELHTDTWDAWRNWTQRLNLKKIPDMGVARSGHGCSLLTSDRSQVIVSGIKPPYDPMIMTTDKVGLRERIRRQ